MLLRERDDSLAQGQDSLLVEMDRRPLRHQTGARLPHLHADFYCEPIPHLLRTAQLRFQSGNLGLLLVEDGKLEAQRRPQGQWPVRVSVHRRTNCRYVHEARPAGNPQCRRETLPLGGGRLQIESVRDGEGLYVRERPLIGGKLRQGRRDLPIDRGPP